MIVKSHNPNTGKTYEGKAVITTDHSRSSHGMPVLLIEGEPLGVQDAVIAEVEIISATPEERAALKKGLYQVKTSRKRNRIRTNLYIAPDVNEKLLQEQAATSQSLGAIIDGLVRDHL